MTRRTVLLAIAGLALWAAPASAQGGGPAVKAVGQVIYHSELIPAGATVKFTVTCPKGYGVVAGAVSSAQPGAVLVLSKMTPSAAGWNFGWRNLDSDNPKTVVVMITCAKALPPAAIMGASAFLFPPAGKQKVRQALFLALQPSEQDTITVPCPKDKVILSYDKELKSGKTTGGLPYSEPGIGDVQFTSVVPSRHGVKVAARNPSATPQTIAFRAHCAPETFTGGRRDAKLQTAIGRFDVDVGASGGVVRGACPKQLPLLTGFSLPPDGSLGFVGAGFSKGPFTSSWALSNSTGATQPARVHLVCMPGKFKAVRGLPPDQTIETVVGPIQITG
jgi:hypothetical protein